MLDCLKAVARAEIEKESAEWDRSCRWVKYFAAELQAIAERRGVTLDYVRTFAQKHIRGKVAYARVAVEADIDVLIERHPLWGPWYVELSDEPSTVRFSMIVEPDEDVTMVRQRQPRASNDYGNHERVETLARSVDGHVVSEATTEMRPGDVLVMDRMKKSDRQEEGRRMREWATRRMAGEEANPFPDPFHRSASLMS
jgi:hypothetical protein